MAFPGEVSRRPLHNVTAEITEIVESGHRLPDGLGYVATVGIVELSDALGKQSEPCATASFAAFDVAETDPSRLVVFECPGGPISPAEAGVRRTGPMVVVYGADGRLPDSPHLVPNEFTPLPVARLVYYDAPGTGYGHALPGKDPEHYFGVERDAEAFTAFVERYLLVNDLEDNPVAFAMSSYSAFRGTEAARLLAKRGKIPALIRINPSNDYAASVLNPGANKEQRGIGHPKDPRLYALPLPSLAATAQHHERLGAREQALSDDELFDEVREFANGIYTDALAHPHALSAVKHEEIIRKLECYTGLSRRLFEKDLRINIKTFTENLLNDSSQVVSTLDGRIALPKPDTVRIEPVVDLHERVLKGIVEGYFVDLGFPEEAIPEGGYRGIIQAYPKWGFDGKDWRDRSTYRAMADLLAAGVSVVDLLGTYDLITPPGFAEKYWKAIMGSGVGRFSYRDAYDPQRIEPGVTVFRLAAGHNIGTIPSSREFLGEVIRTIAGQTERGDSEHGSSVDSAQAKRAEIISLELVRLTSVLSRLGRDIDVIPLGVIVSKFSGVDDCRTFGRLVDSIVCTVRGKDWHAVELNPEMSGKEAWLELLDELYNLLGGERPNQEKSVVERTLTENGPMPYPNMRTQTASGVTIEETWYKDAQRSNELIHRIEFIGFKAGSAADYI